MVKTTMRKKSLAIFAAVCALALAFGIGAGGRTVTAEEADIVYDQAVVYDISDITKTNTFNPLYNGQQIGSFPGGETANAALKTKIIIPEGMNTFSFSVQILGTHDWMGPGRGGYTLYISDGTVEIQCYEGTWPPNNGGSAVATPDAMKSGEYEIEFGAVKYYENGEWTGNYIYVNLNGELLTERIHDTEVNVPGETEDILNSYKQGGPGIYMGQELGANTNSVTFKTCKYIPTPTYADAENFDLREVSDYYELEFNAIGEMLIGSLPKNSNAAFSAYVTIPETSAIDLINFAVFQNTRALWPHLGGGYQLNITAGEVYFSYSPNYRQSAEPVVAELPGSRVALPENMKSGNTYFMEIGMVDYFEDNEFSGYYVYLKVNGEIVSGGVDRNLQNNDKGMYIIGPMPYNNGPFSIKSEQEEPQYVLDQPIVYDLYDITHSREAKLNNNPWFPRNFGNTEYNINVAFKTKVTMPEGGTFGTPRLAILQTETSIWSSDRSGYYITLQSGGITLFRDWDIIMAQRSSLEGMTAGCTYELEFGAVKCWVDGEHIGNYVYVKVNGEEFLHAVDETDPFRGKYIVGANYDDERDKLTFSTTYDFCDITYGGDKTEIYALDHYYVLSGGDITIPVVCLNGTEIENATFGGTDVTENLEKTEKGYILKLQKVTTGGELIFTARTE